MVNFACFAGFEHDADPRAFRLAHQVMVHRAAGGQAADGYAFFPYTPVRQDHEAVALADGRLGLGADPVQRAGHALVREIAGEGDVDGPGPPAAVIQVLQHRQLLVVENGVGHPQAMGVFARGFQQIGLRAHITLQRHDHFFTDRIDRRIGDLGKQLLEVVVEHAGLVAEACQRSIVAHGTYRVAELLHQRLQHELHGLDGVTERLHPRQQSEGVQCGGRLHRGGRQVLQGQPFRLQPLCIGCPAGELLLQLLVGHQSTGYEVDEKHASRLQPALVLHHGRVHRKHTDLAGHDDPVVVSEVVAAGPEAVSVQHRADVIAVGEGDGRRTVPGLHHTGVKFVERPLVLGHQGIFLPRLGNHHHDRLLQRTAGHEQELKHVVEDPGVGAVRLHHREQPLDGIAEQVGMGHALARGHPVDVALQGVDFTVMAHEAVGLGPVPTRERIRRKSRMDHGQVGSVVRLPQIGIKRHQLAGREHPLVNQHLGGQAGHVERLALAHAPVRAKQVAGPLADQVKLAFEGVAAESFSGDDEHLLDSRRSRQRRGAYSGFLRVGWNLPPSDQMLAFLRADPGHRLLAFLPLRGIVGKEDDTRGELAGLRQVLAEFVAGDSREELVGQCSQDSGAVSGSLLRTAGAAVIHSAKQVFGIGEDFMAALALDVGHKADATAIVLPVGRVQAVCGRRAARRPDVVFPIHSSPGRANAPSFPCRANCPQRSPCGRIA